jgi:hypothetical protein
MSNSFEEAENIDNQDEKELFDIISNINIGANDTRVLV